MCWLNSTIRIKGIIKMEIIKSIDNLFSIVRLKLLRNTPGVSFNLVPDKIIKNVSSVDRVIHHSSAVSPGSIGDITYPWYMHPDQDDNLMVLHGTRHVDLYSVPHGKIETFIVTPDGILQNGKSVTKEPAMLIWPKNIFHRVRSDKAGSASINFAVHHENFDIKTNFSVYDLNTKTGEYKVIREGHLDQQ